MINDRKIVISVGASRKSINWQRQEINFSDFVEKLRKPIRSTETLEAYLKMTKTKQDELKDVGGFVGGALKGVRRKSDAVDFRDLITLDFDNINSDQTPEVIKRVMTLGCSYVIYSTRKHASYKPRLRIILPTDRSVSPDEYEPIARFMAKLIGIEMADPTTFEASRLMYWPSCSHDSEYVFKYEDKPLLSADGILNKYSDWKDISSWPQVPGNEVSHRRLITRQQDPTTKNGIIGAFCRTYDIYSAMDEFIPKAYDSTGEDNRFTYMGGSTTGGAIVYENGKFLYSHHATDPCGGELVNAWDLIRLHKFGNLDDEAAEGTPVATLPSTSAMKDLARNDVNVTALLNKERQEQSKTFFEAIGQGDVEKDTDDSWREILTYDNQGKCEKTISNVCLILENDPNFKNKIFFDEFGNRGMVDLPLPWEDGKEPRLWGDFDDAQLALRLEKEYGITGRDKIENAIKVVAFNNRRNAVKEYLDSLKWDGEERVETLFTDYLGAEDNLYNREIIKKALVAAIARALSPNGVKFDNMIVFSGPQGIGKSTFLSKLGGEWFNDSMYTFEGKEAAELLQGTLIIEVGELSAMTKSEDETIKQFLSKTHDIYREAYGKRVQKYPRRCVFFGSTNSESFLKDPTGSRRFWPVRVGEIPKRKDVFKDLDKEVDQIWAEAHWYYMLGESLMLSEDAEELAKKMQEDYRDIDPKEGAIMEYLDRKVPSNWYEMSVQDQRAFYNNSFVGTDEENLIEREKVCVAEIWQVCFGGDMKYLKRRDSNEIVGILTALKGWKRNKYPKRYGVYGNQKGFGRKKIYNIEDLRREKR